jgi:hypothetical protein
VVAVVRPDAVLARGLAVLRVWRAAVNERRFDAAAVAELPATPCARLRCAPRAAALVKVRPHSGHLNSAADAEVEARAARVRDVVWRRLLVLFVARLLAAELAAFLGRATLSAPSVENGVNCTKTSRVAEHCVLETCPRQPIDVLIVFRLDARVTFWGLVEVELREAVELFASREDAEAALADVLRDEPSWRDLVVVQQIEFSGLSWN